ncbi:flagellar biosynthesis protein [Salirhabdus euzebyi]|uniref:Flagellar biosynthesis protein n=1 Tax=Salirhabdus euzebyi TaxID=394506 RepID=A0A841Q3I9_9BACI|nr:EscU/YscU/HrcU family type III secretion system export apparatus switch protein [Salirhabdus euzebyi]MBB6452940.1 flagellar biosynthesis protein [Salirhabdus euzebyi]
MSPYEKFTPKKAIALKYNGQQEASPKVVATGKGIVASNIVQKAETNGVPIKKDATLAELLSQLHINENIPEDLYQVVAEVFAFIYHADKAFNKKS